MKDSPTTLTPGVGFHLGPDGQWKVEKIPDEVLKTAKFSGYLTIKGYRSTVFETPDHDQWGQKSEGTPAMASIAQRVAVKYLQAQQDITTQLKESLENDEMAAWNRAAQEFYSKVQDDFLPDLDKAHTSALEDIQKQIDKFPKANHPRVDGHEATKLRTVIDEYVGDVKQAKEKLDSQLVEMFKESTESDSETTQVASDNWLPLSSLGGRSRPVFVKGPAGDEQGYYDSRDGGLRYDDGVFHPDDLDSNLQWREMPKSEPAQIASSLRSIASKIDNSKNPSQQLVIEDLKRVLAFIDE